MSCLIEQVGSFGLFSRRPGGFLPTLNWFVFACVTDRNETPLQKIIRYYIREIEFFVKSHKAQVAEACDLKCRPMNSNQTFTLAHISDPHLADPRGSRFSDFLNKRFFGYLKWRLKRKSEHHTDVLTAMVQDIRDARPDHIALRHLEIGHGAGLVAADHIVVTGDLTHLGLAAEYAKAKSFLEALGSASQVTVIPGNHDAYVDGALDCRLVEWADYMVSDGIKFCDGLR